MYGPVSSTFIINTSPECSGSHILKSYVDKILTVSAATTPAPIIATSYIPVSSPLNKFSAQIKKTHQNKPKRVCFGASPNLCIERSLTHKH